ncbi:MAG: chemotaxis protein CheD [Trichloromonas sp.]|jgi:chemotaxis protein CheD|nr:chemotaxis protein CheD [Trichloromonas sp.]
MTPLAQLPKIYLKPGELTINEHPAEVSTVLGSCVAVTLYSPRHIVGAICHAMLPRGGEGGGFKYVDGALRHMLDTFDRLGIPRNEIEAKLFGGSDMFPVLHPTKTNTVGRQNIAMAQQLLQEEGLIPRVADVGGGQGRKLVFYPHTGEVFLKRLGQDWREP